MVQAQNGDECGGGSEGNECLYIYIYIYIYRERERERERERGKEVLMPSVIGLYHVFLS